MSDTLSRPHFDAIAGSYAGATGALDPLYAAIRGELDAAVAGKDVLDIGSAGIFAYNYRLAASVTSLDLSPLMLERVPAGVRAVAADARDMHPLGDASFDVAFFGLSLHHVVGNTLAETEAGQKKALAEAFRVLRPGGQLIVYEPVLSFALHATERALYRFFSALISLAGVPPVYLRSRASLMRLADFEVVTPRLTGWVDPLSGTFPGFLYLPIAIFPTRYELFLTKKPHG